MKSKLLIVVVLLMTWVPLARAQTVPLHRYYNGNPYVIDHFYTGNFQEIGCGANGWLFEGTIGHLLQNPAPGTRTLYRYWSTVITDHFYTTNPGELFPGFNYQFEGAVGQIFDSQQPGTVGLRRFWNGTAGDHLYTTDPNENPSGYVFEGTIGYVYPGVTQTDCRPRTAAINFPDICLVPLPGAIWTQQFSDGGKLEVTCQLSLLSGTLLPSPAYMLWYTRPTGERYRIAQCLFGEGINSASLRFMPNGKVDGLPDTLISTQWENLDGGANDGPRAANGFVLTTSSEPYLDVLTFDYNAVANKLSWKNEKYEYPAGTSSVPSEQTFSYVFGQGRKPVPNLTHEVDPEVNATTESLFESMMQALQPYALGPMSMAPACDLNFDGRCNAADTVLIQATVGACVGDANYRVRADVDRSGCVDGEDAETLFSSQNQVASGCVRGLGYWKNQSHAWPVDQLVVGGQTMLKDDLMRALSAPPRGDSSVTLKHHLIAAELNRATGASAPNGLIAAGDSLLQMSPPLRESSLAVATLLESFNKGQSIVESCTGQ